MPRANANKAAKPAAATNSETPPDGAGFEARVEQVTKPARTGETVSIACKIPMGFRLQFYTQHERNVRVGANIEKEITFVRDPNCMDEIVLHGSAVPYGKIPRFRIEGGAAITTGVRKDLWDRWCRENPKHPALVNRQIFAAPNVEKAAAMAKEERSNLSGLQPMLPEKDKRIPRRRNKAGQVSKDPAIVTAEDQTEEAA